MKNKNRLAMTPITVERGKLVEITDPREQAELDRRCRAGIRAIEGEFVMPPKKRTRRSK